MMKENKVVDKPNVCFLDMDSVITDFYLPALKAVGLTKEYVEANLPPGPEAWRLDEKFMSKNDFWGAINSVPNFWESLPKTQEADEIVKICEKYFGDNVFLLTSPPHHSNAYSGKATWVKENLPKYRRKLFIGPKKYAFAHSKAVLIDDSEENCEKFRKAGGKIVLVPRRGNSLHHREHELLTVLEEELEHLLY